VAELEVPLFYQGQGEAAVALAEMRREQKLHNDTAVRLRSRARAVASRLTATTESVRFYEATVLPLRAQVVRETQLQYNAMSVGVFQLLQAQRDQVAAAEAYVSLLHDYWAQRTELEQLLAGGLPAWSAGTMTPTPAARGSTQADAH
jgi:cobalt-zinc-cadmium efflux system outer membrane protein